MKTRVIGIGAGGHAKGIIEMMGLSNHFRLVGLLDASPRLKGKSIFGVPVLGNDSLMQKLKKEGIRHFVLGVGSVGDSQNKRRLYQKAIQNGFEPITVIHPTGFISRTAQCGRGLVVMAGGVVHSAILGENVIVNTGAIVEHDCIVGSHAHLASGSVLCGGVSVGEGGFIGAGAVVRQGVKIGRNAVVGAGAVVLKDVPIDTIVVGVPARPLRGKKYG